MRPLAYKEQGESCDRCTALCSETSYSKPWRCMLEVNHIAAQLCLAKADYLLRPTSACRGTGSLCRRRSQQVQELDALKPPLQHVGQILSLDLLHHA